jgi:hypothetical protein
MQKRPPRGQLLRQVLTSACCVATMVACERSPRAAAKDTADTVQAPESVAVALPVNPGWEAADGSLLLVSAGSPTTASLVAPGLVDADGTAPDISLPHEVRLLSRDGRSTTASITSIRAHDNQVCLAWPRAEISGSRGPWSIGFVTNGAEAVALDSVLAMSRSDSARLAADIARMASALKDDTSAAFRGLPFVVREMRRFSPAEGVQSVVADVARLLATEANPREERLFLLAEKRDGGEWSVRYSRRASGPEESVEATDIRGVVRFPDGRVVMILSVESSRSTRYEILRRHADGSWRSQWRSAETDC